MSDPYHDTTEPWDEVCQDDHLLIGYADDDDDGLVDEYCVDPECTLPDPYHHSRECVTVEMMENDEMAFAHDAFDRWCRETEAAFKPTLRDVFVAGWNAR